MSCRIFIGRPLEFGKFASNVLELPILSRNAIRLDTGRPVELLYWTSTRVEDLAESNFLLHSDDMVLYMILTLH